jgi:DNA-binding transcriptional LysR family regulator
MRSFDIAFLRSFVAVAEAGTLRRAGEQRARSTAAISQQMRALEGLAGVSLFERAGGKVLLSAQGRALLPYARELIRLNDEAMHALQRPGAGTVRFGMPQDFAASALAEALAGLARTHPQVLVEAHVERNSRVAAMFSEGALDLALLIGRAGAAGGEAVAQVPGMWLAREDFRITPGTPLPLLLLEPPCLFREFALEALARAGIAYRVAFTSPSVSGLWAALRAGVGVTARMPIGLPQQVGSWGAPGLPPPPPVRLSLHRRGEGHAMAVDALFAIVAEALQACAGPREPSAAEAEAGAVLARGEVGPLPEDLVQRRDILVAAARRDGLE